MGYTGFVIAMAANIDFAACSLPSRILDRSAEYLIASRWGGEGEFLAVSRTGRPCRPADAAPIGLTPQATWLGLLLSEESDYSESRFLLLRQLPAGMVLAGRFVPADGYLRLSRAAPWLHLRAEGRHADCADRSACALHRRGRAARAAPSALTAWHVEANRLPWHGEFVATPRP